MSVTLTLERGQQAPVHPQFSVVTVVFNGASTLESAMLSVLGQVGASCEYIVIDGASTDGSLDIIKRYEHRLSFWSSEADSGVYDAFNKAIAVARGEWIYFLGADDRLAQENVLARIGARLDVLGKDVVLAYGTVNLVDRDGMVVGSIGQTWEQSCLMAGKGMFVPHQGLFQRRSWFERYGVFDADYRIAGDYEMMLRGWGKESAEFFPDVVVAYMANGGVSSAPKNALRHLREVAKAQSEHGWPFQWRLAMAFFRTYVRLALQVACGEKITSKLLDRGRRLIDRKSHRMKK